MVSALWMLYKCTCHDNFTGHRRIIFSLKPCSLSYLQRIIIGGCGKITREKSFIDLIYREEDTCYF